MTSQFDIFKRYAKEHLSDTAFETSYDSDNSHLFHISLDSLVHLSRWTAQATNKSGETFDLVAGFTDLYSPNAFADRYQSFQIIGMHVPLFVAINEFALFCFAQAGFFPELGDASKEVSPSSLDERVPGIWLLDHTSKGGTVTNDHSNLLIPKDTERYHLASVLSFLMTRFVWLHELSHAFNGHVDHARQNRIAFRLCELPDARHAVPASMREGKSAEQRRADAQTLQCLEFDADKSALWGSLQVQLGNLENIESIRVLSPDTRIKLTLFGGYAMSWLIEQFEAYLKTSGQASHPQPILRLQSAFRTVRERLLTQEPELSFLNRDVLNQFDEVRMRIPSLYATEGLTDLFEQPFHTTGLAAFEDRRLVLERELLEHQYAIKKE